MSKSVRLRRGSTLDHQQFVGAEGEITVDTTLDTLRIHDGITLGGFPLLNSTKNSQVTADEFVANKILYKNSYATQASFPDATQYPGMLAFSQADQKAYISNGTAWVSFTQPSDLTNFVTGSSIVTGATGETLIPTAIKSGTNLLLKTLRSGNNVTLVSDATGITVSSANFDGENVADNVLGTFGIYQQTIGTSHKFRSFRLGSGLNGSVSVSDDEINLDTILKKSFNRITVDGQTIEANEGEFTSLTLVAGSGLSISLNDPNKSATFDLDLSVVNDTNQTGQDVLQSYASGSFVFNKLSAGDGVVLSTGTNGEVVISAPQVGTITDGENLGIGPADGGTAIAILEDTLSTDSVLKFRRLRPGLGMVITMSPDQQYVDIESTLSVPGGAQAGVVNIGDQNQLAYYPNAQSSNTVGPTPTGIAIDVDSPDGPFIVSNITGQVSDISNHDTDSLTEGSTNLYYTTTRFNEAFDLKSTDHLSEGVNNLYFTDERAQDAIGTMIGASNPERFIVSQIATAASTSIATITVASTSGIVVGMTVSGPGFPAGVTVQNVGVGIFTVSPAVYAPLGTSITLTGGTTLILNTTANTSSTATITFDDTSGFNNGMYVTAVGISGKATITEVNAGNIIVTPGYNVQTALGATISASTLSTNGITTNYDDDNNSFEFILDPTYLGDQIRNALSVVPNQGLSYDPVQGRFGLAGAVTSVNGFSGAVQLDVGDIAGAAPIDDPTFTGTPRVPNLTAASNGFEIANKTYVDNTRTAITGTTSAGLATLQALGAAINNDTLFYQTVNNALNAKLNTSGGTLNGLLNLNYTIDFSTTDQLVAVNKRYVDQRAAVQSVNTKVGNVVLLTDDITERTSPSPTNLWFTQQRARQAISLVSDDLEVMNYTISTGQLNYTKPDSDKINEGTNNLYFTVERVRQNIDLTVNGNVSFASYDEASGVITINATSDNISQGVTNKFYQSSLVWEDLQLNTSGTQQSFLTYNDQTGIFTINPNTDYLVEGTNKFFTNSLARLAISRLVTSNPNTPVGQALTYDNTTGLITFNANTDNIVEGDNNLYYTSARARNALSLTSTDTTVLDYDSATGVFTFTKPNSDKIVEGSTNLYFTDARAQAALSVAVTSTDELAVANSLTFANGVFTFNANTDNIVEGANNLYATVSSVGEIVNLTTLTTDGATPPALIAYSVAEAKFTFNNSTDSLREGTVNKWASNETVRNKFTVNSNTALRYGGASGIIDAELGDVIAGEFYFNPSVSPDLVWRANPAEGQYNFETAQNLTSSGRPQFMNVSSRALVGIVPSSGDVSFDLSQAQVFEVNRDSAIANLFFTNWPTALDGSRRVMEVTVVFVTTVRDISFANSNSNIKFQGGGTPTLTNTENKRDIFTFISYDPTGTIWYEKSRTLNV